MDIDRGFKKIIEHIEIFSKLELLVGIPSDAGVNPKTSTPIAEYARYNEEGTANIPARSFMKSTFEEKNGWQEPIKFAFSQVLAGEDPVTAAAKFVGELAVNDIKEKISSDISPENAPSTVDRKTKGKRGKTKGKRGKTRTLIDTGAMRRSVTYKIRMK